MTRVRQNGRLKFYITSEPRFLGLLALASALTLLDWAVTYYCVSLGLAEEANPLFAAAILTPAPLLAKLGLVAALASAVAYLRPRYPGAAEGLLAFYITLYSVILAWNAKFLLCPAPAA